MGPRMRAASAVGIVVVLAAGLSASGVGTDSSPAGRPGTAQGAPDASQVASPSTVDPSNPTEPAPPPPPGALPSTEAVLELRQAGAEVVVDSGGHVLAVTAPPEAPLALAPDVDTFVRRYAGAFGVVAGQEVTATGSAPLPEGDVVVRYRQTAANLPILGGEVLVTADASGKVRAATAETTSMMPVATDATVDSTTAVGTAIEKAAALSGLDASVLRATAELWLYDPRLIGAPGRSELRPTWIVSVTTGATHEVATVLVDGLDGAVVLAISAEESARDRIVCDLANTRVNLDDLNAYACDPDNPYGRAATTRQEGGPASPVAEVNRAYDHLGATLDFYQSTFGRDSYNDRGAKAKVTVRACQVNLPLATFPCPFPNAFWNGYQMVFGDGWATDDVVGHEFTHAVIDHASQLFYAYESGAINEALADIMGELIDQSYTAPGENTSKLWLIAEDRPVTGGEIPEIRDMANPNRLGQPWQVYGAYWSFHGPNSPYWDNGGVHTNSGPANYAAYLIASGGTAGGQTITGIGLAKSAQLWYRVMHQLASGSDYRALGRTLTSACLQLVGRGMTRADCESVYRATLAVGMTDGGATDCGPNQVVEPPVLFEDFESRSGWNLDGPGWQYIPSPDVPVRYAYSGTSALDGFIVPGQGPITAELTTSFVVPPANIYSHRYIFFRLNQFGSGATLLVEYFTQTSGWTPLATYPVGPSRGYELKQAPLGSGIEGSSVRLRFRLIGNGGTAEVLIDDVMYAGCNVTVLEDPRLFSAELVGTTGVLTWEASTFPQYRFDISYDPPIPGAPTTVPAVTAPPTLSTNTYTVTIENLNPDLTYQVSIEMVNTMYGGRSRAITATLTRSLPPVCATSPPQFLIVWVPPKQRPNQCPGELPPRRD